MKLTDLMQMHGETLEDTDFQEARHDRLMKNIMKNIAARAAVLFTDAGYTRIRTMDTENVTVFQVRSPMGNRYGVKVSQTPAPAGSFFGSQCSCPCFTDHKTCKHLLACQAIVDTQQAEEARFEEARFEAQAAAFDALMADGETSTGCDAYARY